MHRGVKIVLATGVLLVGTSAAMLFRHPSPKARAPKPGASDRPVFRQQSGPWVPALPTPDRLTAQIEPSAEASHPVARAAQPRADSDPSGPGEPPLPPVLAKSYPPFDDRVTSRKPALMRPQRSGAECSAEPKRTHKIVDGDTLPDLAERYLGDANRYREIYEANRDLLPSAEVLPIGVELKIPPRRNWGPSSPGLTPRQPPVPLAPRRHAHGPQT